MGGGRSRACFGDVNLELPKCSQLEMSSRQLNMSQEFRREGLLGFLLKQKQKQKTNKKLHQNESIMMVTIFAYLLNSVLFTF